MSELEIEYCVPCGLLPAAEATAHALLSSLGERIGALRMKPGHGGVFKVRVDGEVIFDKASEGYDPEAILVRVHERLRTASRS
ncbi:MAG TPA: Rdx family protein [Actinomycetota bacterium]|jgi:selenoprotein W-related protein|nr:Rdx family protein [Actinomycetota bacterium]